LPWFTFSGIAEHAQGTVQVSGEVSAFGSGKLYAGGAKVTMWSSTKHWDSGSSDFLWGYLIVTGLTLVLISALFFLITKRPKISMLLTLIGCALLVAASTISFVYYKPHTFVVTGYIYGAEGVDIALLYTGHAVVEKGLGFLLPPVGAFLSLIGMVLAVNQLKGRR
jgi:hypothetical protein